VLVGFPVQLSPRRCARSLVGNPVRAEIAAARAAGAALRTVAMAPVRLLVLGGSQGARA
jgi:UDP-N-acetylglucosamine:LPS N-acetylglucosamine transferase